jgi:superfamily II DNA helicase RecQ
VFAFTDWDSIQEINQFAMRGNIFIISVKQANLVNGRNILRSLYEMKQLSRIVVDEAHKFVYSISYRDDVLQLRNLLSIIPVPLVMLSATLTPTVMAKSNLADNHEGFQQSYPLFLNQNFI